MRRRPLLPVRLRCSPAQTVTTLYNFAGGKTSGETPWYVTLVQGTNGSLYGTTYNGGASGVGTVFSVTTSGTQTLLYSFKGGTADGANPTGGLTLGSDGNFYGTTQQGGTGTQGVVFKMTTAGVITILHNFNATTDGAFPWGPPILASDGNFYGTTSGGGLKGNGLVYKITSTGTYTTIYEFDVTHGFAPIAPPTQGTDGYLYIPVSQGGTSFCGTIIQLTTAGIVNNTYDFPCGSGGSYPIGPLIQASNGNFYSTTQDGGTNGEGTIYQVTTGLAVTILHSFRRDLRRRNVSRGGIAACNRRQLLRLDLGRRVVRRRNSLQHFHQRDLHRSLQLQQHYELHPDVPSRSSGARHERHALRCNRIRRHIQRRYGL